MSKIPVYYKWIPVLAAAVGIFCWGQIANSGQMPSVAEGHDFTILAADADYKPGELLVRFAPKSDGKRRTTAERNQILASIDGGTIKHSYKIVSGLTLVKLPAGQTVEDALKTFNGTNGILYAEPNYKRKYASKFPNDPNFAQLWGLHNIGQGGGTWNADIDAPEAWDIHTGSSDVIVAVLDSGVDYNHPDLADNMWTDANGYYGYDFGSGDSDPMDDYGHGTKVAGIIGAVGDNNEGLTGVCWNIAIMAVKISIYSGSPTIAAEVNGIEYAIQMEANVLNLSLGGTEYTQPEKDAIEAADANGLLVVAAAMNDGSDNDTTPIYPASYDCNNIISVMATDQDDKRSIWPLEASNYGANSVDLAAPGTDIWVCVPGGGYDDQGYGTSTAAPYVAGACALVWSANPELSHLEVKQIVLDTVDLIPALDGNCVTGGRLNLYNAIVEAANQVDVLSVVDDVNDGNSVSPGDEITYTTSFDSNLTDVNIVDYLPDEVNYPDPNDPNYDDSSHTYTWTPGDNDPNFVELTVVVNNSAEPLGVLTNVCVIDANEIQPTTAVEITDVNCWDSGVIYVDVNAAGSDTGMSWENAYLDLHSALERAGQGCGGSQIWVAEGTYYGDLDFGDRAMTLRSTNPNDCNVVAGTIIHGSNHELPVVDFNDNSGSVVAGFTIKNGVLDGIRCINGSSVDIINCDIQNNGSDLYHDGDGVHIKQSSANVKNCKIQNNGVGGQGAFWHGVDCYQSSVNITNCEILNNRHRGVYCVNDSSVIVANSKIQGNGWAGIYCNDSNSTTTNCIIIDNSHGIRCEGHSSITVAGSRIQSNYYEGILCEYSESVIKNSWITDNGTSGDDDGIFFKYPDGVPILRNCTIAYNTDLGVNSWGTDPNITNCIVWGNTYGQLYNCTATYSCIGDCNEIGDSNVTHNICTDPCFVDDANDDFHLALDSPCINAGDPNGSYSEQVDIDGDMRVYAGIVDIGADESVTTGLCPGDVTGTVTGYVTGGPPDFIDYFDINLWEGPDGNTNSTDVQALIFLLNDCNGSVNPVPAQAAAGDITDTVTGWVTGGPPLFIDYFDMNLWQGPSGTLNSTDVQALIFLLNDSNGLYICP